MTIVIIAIVIVIIIIISIIMKIITIIINIIMIGFNLFTGLYLGFTWLYYCRYHHLPCLYGSDRYSPFIIYLLPLSSYKRRAFAEICVETTADVDTHITTIASQ